MLTFLLSTVGKYLVGGLLVAALVGGGYLYISHLRAENTRLKTEVVALQRVNEIYEHDAETDKEIANEKNKVDKLSPAELESEYQRLRDYGHGKGKESPKAGD